MLDSIFRTNGERRAVESGGGRIQFLSFVPGKSTTGIIERLRNP